MSLVRGLAFVAAICLSGGVCAQQAKLPRIGVLANTIPTKDLVAGTTTEPAIVLLMEGLRERGWIPGKSVEMVWRSAEGDYARHSQQARELAQTCDVIVVYGACLDAAMSATKSVPIVTATSMIRPPLKDDKGLVRIASLGRPGGNVTGLTIAVGVDLFGKRLELLKAAAPRAKRVAILSHAPFQIPPRARKVAESFSLELAVYAWDSAPEKLEPVFAQMSRDRVDAVIVFESPAAHFPPTQKNRAPPGSRLEVLPEGKSCSRAHSRSSLRLLPAASPVRRNPPCLAWASSPARSRRAILWTVPRTIRPSGRLRARGWVDGKNMRFVWRSAESDLTRLSALRTAGGARAAREPESREGDRPHPAPIAAAAGHAGDRVSRLPRRRRFLLGALLLCDLALAQPARLPRVCILANTIPLADLVAGTSSHFAPRLLVEGFREHGWEPGRNVELLWRSAEGDYSRMPALARELAAACSVIVVFGGPGIDAALRATTTVPIVMATSGVSGRETVDGVVRIDTLARPGGNITGLSLSGGADLNGKRLELLKLAAPGAKRVGILGHNLPHAAVFVGPRTRKAAESLGLELSTYSFASSIEGLAPAFAAMARDRVDAAIVMELPATNLPPVQKEIHRLAERHRMAVIHEVLSAADSGGLMAYGPDITRLVRRTGYYVDRILRGAKAGDLPIEQPAGFELRVNLKAARAIGLTLPQSLLLQATRVIE